MTKTIVFTDILILKIIEYCIGDDNKPNVKVSKNVGLESGVSFSYIYNSSLDYYSKSTTSILSNLSRVNWKFFKIISNNLNRIGYFLIEKEKKRKLAYDLSYSPTEPDYSPTSLFVNKEESKEKGKPKVVEIISIVPESNISFLKQDIIPFSKYKLLNLNNVIEMDNYNSTFSEISNNFKNLSTLVTRFTFESNDRYDLFCQFTNFNKVNNYGNLNVILRITFCKEYGVTKKLFQDADNDDECMVPFKDKEILIIDKSAVKLKKMKYQLKFIKYVNPIYLNWNVDNQSFATDEPHLMFNKKFFNKCKRLKTIKIGNDFMDLSFINMALESEHGIESLSCNILFHYIYYINNNPSFNPEPQLDYLRLSDLMPHHGTVKIPTKSTLCNNSFDSRKTHDSYTDFISQFSKLSSNISTSKSLKTLKLYNYCTSNFNNCYNINKQYHGCTTVDINNREIEVNNIYFEFINSIENNESIAKLSFSNLQFGTETNQLVDSLINNKSIIQLSLKNGVLRGDQDIDLILKLLSSNKRIIKLNISNNNFKKLDQLIQILNNHLINHNVKIKLDNIGSDNDDTSIAPHYNHYTNYNQQTICTKSRLDNEITNKFITILPYKSTNDSYKMYTTKSFKNKEINL